MPLILRKKTYILSLTALAALIIAGCSAEKNTGSSRFYHALISKYNIYFNGNEAYKKGVEKVRTGIRDDYSNLIPVFEYSLPESANLCSGEMERAVQKTSKVIALHSITAKPEKKDRLESSEKDEAFMKKKEYNVWVDDSYLLMAKAQFYQKKFDDARTTIAYLRDISDDKNLLDEASVWYSRILTEEKSYGLAENILKEITGQESFRPSMKAMISSTYADILLRQKRYSEAVPHLINAVKYSTDKASRIRFTYLLAQVCQKEGDNALSTKYFREVIQMKPPYEIEFNAGINLAGVADITSDSDAAGLKKILLKMLNDVKNKEYLDQIYFALGELSRRQSNMNQALENYRLSAKKSTANPRQKGKAYLALGSFYYSLPDYVRAQNYYDSAIAVIDENFPDFKSVKERSSGLNEYIRYHDVVVREDSLRKVAGMSAQQRETLVMNIINDLKKKREAEKMTGTNDMSKVGRSYENEQRYRENIAQEGNWYFYNQTALTFGRTEFKRRWGDRKLEDNWRRQNKARVTPVVEDEETVNGVKTLKPGEKGETSDDLTPEFYLKHLPLSDSLVAQSFDKGTTASLNEGKVLASKLRDTLQAVGSMEKAIIPQASAATQSEALYNLYLLLKNNNQAAAKENLERLLRQYPESEYAKIISDPDYVKKQTEKEGLCAALYNNAYYSFKQSAYNDVINICNEAAAKYPDNELQPKFMLLRAMASGGLSGEFAYKAALDTLVARYPSTEEAKRAQEIIELLKKEKPQIQVAEDTKIAGSLYLKDLTQPHYILIIAGNTSANLNQMVFDVINYNLDNFQNKNYRTEGTSEPGKYLMITVSLFSNASEAKEYLGNFDAQKIIRNAADADISVYIISKDNLAKLRTDKSQERYRIFYNSNYQDIK